MKYNSNMTFAYNGWGRNISMTIEDDDADFLPKVLDNVAAFLRAAGFEYVGVRKEGKTYIFHHEYDWKEPSLEEESFYDLDDLMEDIAQEEALKAADDYWETAIKDALDQTPWNKTRGLTKGDTVLYISKGRADDQYAHGGYKGVSLYNMRGTVIDIQESPIGNRVLVKWDNWNDGHNGMGSDPDAKMSEKSYWWTDVENLSK